MGGVGGIYLLILDVLSGNSELYLLLGLDLADALFIHKGNCSWVAHKQNSLKNPNPSEIKTSTSKNVQMYKLAYL